MRNNPFQKAVENTPETATCFRIGLQAFVGNHSSKIRVADTSQLAGSVELDECVKRLYPESNRWDYIFCYRSYVYFVEVHSANTGEVSTVLLKLQWLKDWLHQKAPEIKKMRAPIRPYYWVQSSGMAILKTSPQYRRLTTVGLLPVPTVVLE